VSANVLQRAAEQIRADHDDPHSEPSSEDLAWLAVADWLDTAAVRADRASYLAALDISRAYLGEG